MKHFAGKHEVFFFRGPTVSNSAHVLHFGLLLGRCRPQPAWSLGHVLFFVSPRLPRRMQGEQSTFLPNPLLSTTHYYLTLCLVVASAEMTQLTQPKKILRQILLSQLFAIFPSLTLIAGLLFVGALHKFYVLFTSHRSRFFVSESDHFINNCN